MPSSDPIIAHESIQACNMHHAFCKGIAALSENVITKETGSGSQYEQHGILCFMESSERGFNG